MKRLFPAILLEIAVLMCCFAYCAFAESVINEGYYGSTKNGGKLVNIYYQLTEDGVMTFSGSGPMQDDPNRLYIPWKDYTSQIMSVVVGDGITSVGDWAFYGCNNLSSVSLPNSLTAIGKNAFTSCGALGRISLPEHLSSIGEYAFSATALTELTIPEEVTSIGIFLCSHCNELTSATILSDIKNIPEGTFNDCKHLTSVSLPDSVVAIGDWAFAYNSFSSFDIPEKVSSIGKGAFYRCEKLTALILPKGITVIEPESFYYCPLLENVTIPFSVTSIGKDAFAQCIAFTSIEIPEGVNLIGDGAFDSCINVTTVSLPESLKSIGVGAFGYCWNLPQLSMPKGIETIGSDAFKNCNRLKLYVYKDSMSHIYASENNIPYELIQPVIVASGTCGNGVTWTLDDEGLLTISGKGEMIGHPWPKELVKATIIENGVTSITDDAFNNCKNMASIAISDTIESIGAYAFTGCSALTEVTIPDNVNNVINNAFGNCNAVRYASLDSKGAKALGKAYYSFRIPGTNYDLRYNYINDVISDLLFCGLDQDVTDVVIPDGVTYISLSFDGFNNLKSITIPDSVTRISSYIFHSCSAVIYANVGSDGAKALGKAGYSFRVPTLNYNLRYLYLDDHLIGLEISNVDKNITNFTVPNGVTHIAFNAFSNCAKMTSILIPDSVSSIGQYAFDGCASLKSVTIPNGVTSIGDEAFRNCINLTTITIPEGLTSIGGYSFSNCCNLTYITLPSSLSFIGHYAFYGCHQLNQMCILSETTVFDSQICSSNPVVYCYEYSDADGWASSNGYNIVYLDTLNMDSSRLVKLNDNCRLGVGQTQRIECFVFPDDKPTIVWHSSTPDIVSINDGIVTAIAPGKATITASIGTISDSMEITVFNTAKSFEVNPSEEWIIAKETLQLSVTSLFPTDAEIEVVWSSSDTSLATVDENGLVSTKKPGDVTISALDLSSGICRKTKLHLCYPVTSICFDSDNITLDVGKQSALNANVTMRTQSCVNHLVSFSSNHPDIAVVDNKGIVTAISHGTAVITATAKSGISASVTVSAHVFEPLPAIAPSCLETGFTKGEKCSVCGEMLVAQQMINALGHDWEEPVYTWSDDHSVVTASRICKRDKTHVETETAPTERTTVFPTMEEAGMEIYNVTFDATCFEAQTLTLGTIPALATINLMVLPDHLTHIEDEAFAGTDCQAVIIPDGCVEIGSRAFADCKGLLYVRIPASVTSIPGDAFAGCNPLTINHEE